VFDYYSFIASFGIRWIYSPTLYFFILLAFLGDFLFHIILDLVCKYLQNRLEEFWLGLHWFIGLVDILTILGFQFMDTEYFPFVYLSHQSLWVSARGYHTYHCTHLGRFIPKCLLVLLQMILFLSFRLQLSTAAIKEDIWLLLPVLHSHALSFPLIPWNGTPVWC
jgi:hypothetical protein